MKTALPAAVLLLLLSASAQTQSQCNLAIGEFRRIIDADAQSGHLNKRIHERIVPELNPVTTLCRAGQDAQALRALQSLKRRYGYPGG
jgi:hypothetical protein